MILSAYARMEARSAKLCGLLTLFVAVAMIDAWGIGAGVVLAAAGGLLLFGVGDEWRIGPESFLIYTLYVVLLIFGIGIGVT